MPDELPDWVASEPGVGSTIDTLRVETIGHHPAKRNSINTRFPFDGFGLVIKGGGFFSVDNGPMRSLQAPAFFYIWAGPLFHYGPEPGTIWEERFLCFSGPRVADWLRWRWLPRVDRPQTVAEPGTLIQMHQRIARAFAPFNDLSIDQAKLEIEQMIHELHRQANPHSPKEDKLAVLIQRWMKEPENAGDLRGTARELGMSYSGFRQHFAQRTGLAPHRFLLRLRIDRVCLRLAQTDEPVKTIALDCGFDVVESFNRVFRQMKGMTPGDYRRRMSLLRTNP